MTRKAARVIVLDPDNRTLLLQGQDPARPQDPTFWFSPGGGIEADEDEQTAARREVREELGIALTELGPVVHRRRASFVFDNVAYEQEEVYFVVRTPSFVVDNSGWTELERRAVIDSRWWSLDELETTTETVFPENLFSLLRRWTT